MTTRHLRRSSKCSPGETRTLYQLASPSVQSMERELFPRAYRNYSIHPSSRGEAKPSGRDSQVRPSIWRYPNFDRELCMGSRYLERDAPVDRRDVFEQTSNSVGAIFEQPLDHLQRNEIYGCVQYTSSPSQRPIEGLLSSSSSLSENDGKSYPLYGPVGEASNSKTKDNPVGQENSESSTSNPIEFQPKPGGQNNPALSRKNSKLGKVLTTASDNFSASSYAVVPLPADHPYINNPFKDKRGSISSTNTSFDNYELENALTLNESWDIGSPFPIDDLTQDKVESDDTQASPSDVPNKTSSNDKHRSGLTRFLTFGKTLKAKEYPDLTEELMQMYEKEFLKRERASPSGTSDKTAVKSQGSTQESGSKKRYSPENRRVSVTVSCVGHCEKCPRTLVTKKKPEGFTSDGDRIVPVNEYVVNPHHNCKCLNTSNEIVEYVEYSPNEFSVEHSTKSKKSSSSPSFPTKILRRFSMASWKKASL